MANLNHPPQAYTREILSHAFEWLHQQTPQVREAASSMDAMVAMYLQAKRRGHAGNEMASAQNFKKDLKHLAEDLKKFESPAPVVPQPGMPQSFAPAPALAQTTGRLADHLDAQTTEILEHVRESFNLSHEGEALRLLVRMGFEHIRQILPKT